MIQRVDFIIPECYIDTNMVETLIGVNGCNHQKGCNQVTKVMQEKFADRFAIGIIDADKRQPSYVGEFNEICSSKHLKLLRHKIRLHFIILISPAADSFILSCAESAQLDMVDFGLSPHLKEFTAETENVLSNKDPRFKRLFKSMDCFGEMKLMKSLISYLSNALYNTTDEALIDIFSTNLDKSTSI